MISDDPKALLQKRARILAQKITGADRKEQGLEVVAFHLGDEFYGVEKEFVQEVFPLSEFTSLPGVPDFVYGVVALRGQVISLMDLRVVFDIARPAADKACFSILFVRHGDLVTGLLADTVAGVQFVAPDRIFPPLPAMTRNKMAYVKGVTPESMILLDIAALLDDPERIVRQED